MPASGLPVAAQQAVEIAKAISLDVRVLIMDEPTASLSAHEVERLFRQVRRLRDEGVAVLFISHRLDEVFEIADRDHRVPRRPPDLHPPAGDVTQASLIAEMVGREVSDFFARSEHHGRARSCCASRASAAPAAFSGVASTCGAARCSASPAWSAPGAPTWRSRCSASHRPRRGRSSSAAGRSTIRTARARR